MNTRCGKTAQCYDDLLKMVQNKDILTIVLFSKFEQENILYKQQYVDKLNARINKAIEYIEKQLECTKKSLDYHMKHYNFFEVGQYTRDCKLYANILEILEGEDNE